MGGSMIVRIVLAGVLFVASSRGLPAESPPSPEDMINALNAVFGRHEHTRGSHAKGFCAAGVFAPSNDGREFSATPLFEPFEIPVTARLSIGGGDPDASDKGRSVRGLGARLHLRNGEELDLVLHSTPVFFAATPQQFIGFMKARKADPATGTRDADMMTSFLAANPNAKTHLDYLAETPPPASYASTPYFSNHAFFFHHDGTGRRAARWIVEPLDGFVGLTEEEERNFPATFLEEEFRERLKTGPAEWDVFLQIAEADDPLNDPTALWPDDRRRINVGRLTIDRLVAEDSGDDCDGFIFDPNNLPTGISATDDPILAIRGSAYAVSFARRLE